MTTIGVSAISALAAILCAYMAWRASKNATTIEARKVDQDAYDRAVKFYQDQLDRLETQVERAHTQLERVTSQLENEQSISYALRQRVRDLETQLQILQDTLKALRRHPDEDPEAATV